LAVLLLSLCITWTLLAVIVGVEANTRGYSGFGWTSLALLASPFIAGCVLMVLVRTRLESRSGDQPTPQRNVEQTKGVILKEIGDSLGDVIRCGPIKSPQTTGSEMKPTFPPWLGDIFSPMRPSVESGLSAPSPGTQGGPPASSDREDFPLNLPARPKMELFKAIGELMRAAETVDRLKSEFTAQVVGKPHCREQFEPMVGGRPLYGRLRGLVFVDRDTAVTRPRSTEDSARIIAGDGSMTGQHNYAGEQRYAQNARSIVGRDYSAPQLSKTYGCQR
jgi:hypothetical protein